MGCTNWSKLIGISLLAVLPIASFGVPLSEAKSLRCSTSGGTSTIWEKGSLRSKSNESVLSYELRNINGKGGVATLVGRTGSGKVTANWTNGAWSFIEQLPNGGVLLTTVFDSKVAGAGRFPAVDSRHNPLLGDPVVSQLYGWCEIPS